MINWDEINRCPIWRVLGVTECDSCDTCVQCWGEETILPEVSGDDLRAIVGQTRIGGYIKDAEAFMPSVSEEQLASMVVLHFDIPMSKARKFVELCEGSK